MPSSTSTPRNSTTQGTFPKIILQLMEQGLMSADEQIMELLTNLQYSQNIYALKYILEHKGDSVPVEVLNMALKSLCSQEFDDVFSIETVIKLEWQLRINTTILEHMFHKGCQFTGRFLDSIQKSISTHKNTHSMIKQHGGEMWKINCAGSNTNVSSKIINDFKCNYNIDYLLKLIKNTLNTACSERTQYQTSINRAVAALKGLLVVVPGLAKVGIKLITGVDIPLSDFDIERSWKYFKEAFHIEPSGKPWYTTWRQLIILQDSLDEWYQQKESSISISFKERVLLEYLWYHISLCYSENAAENQDVSDELWFGVLDIIQQLIHKTFSMTTQAICYYIALDSLNNAITEFIQFKSIEVLLSLEAKNSELFVTTPDDISDCDEKHIPKLVTMYYYLREKLEVESKMILKYTPDKIMATVENKKQQDKGKGKGKGIEKNPIDYIAEDLTCAIVCETVGGFYQLNCQHVISSKALLSLNSPECPYCRSEIRRHKVYYMPQQTIYNNIQQYLRDADYQDIHNVNTENNTDSIMFDDCDELKKQKNKNKVRKYNSESAWSSIWKSLTMPSVEKLFQKANTAYKKKNLEKAVKLYQKAAEQGHAQAQNLLGRCYENGMGVEKNEQKAVEWYQKATKQGNANAQFNLANCYYNGIGVEKDNQKAVEWYEKAAEQGNAQAQFNLGVCYENGIGVEKHEQKAVEWYQKSAEQGHLQAQNLLRRCYENMTGVEKHEPNAVEWYQKFAELGYADAQFNLGVCYQDGTGIEKNEQKAVEWYQKATKQGNANAQFNLANCYYNGIGVEKDNQKAVEWYEKAAEQGNAQAQFNLGVCYENGIGVEKHEQKAVEWYQKSAEQGHLQAQNLLGRCYENMTGVEKHVPNAVERYQKFAELGYADAQFNLGMCYQDGTGIEKNEQKAVEWYQKAAEQGYTNAQFNLGLCYAYGIGVEKDEDEAVVWYQRAAKQRHAHAQNLLSRYYENRTRGEKHELKAVERYQKFAELGYANAQFNLGLCYAHGTGIEEHKQKAVELYHHVNAMGLS